MTPEQKEQADEYVREVMGQRTEILKAFIAKYGCHPDEAVQINAGNKWMIQKIDEEERQRIRMMVITIDENAKLMEDVKLIVHWTNESQLEALATKETIAAYHRLNAWLFNPPTQNVTLPKDGLRPQ